MKNASKSKSVFPKELLNASISERLNYFKTRAIVTHERMEEVIEEIIEAAGSMCDQNLLLLIGPTGVGKTEGLKEAVQRAIAFHRAKAEAKPHVIPAIFVEADAPDKGNFDWRAFYEAGLMELGAPLIDSTLDCKKRLAGDNIINTIAPEENHRISKAGALRKRFRNTVRGRETLLVGIDEAVNLLQVHSTRNKQHRDDLMRASGSSVRSLVNKSTATVVLAGAFDFYALASSSGQLTRRSHVIYFQEYQNTTNDIRAFSRALLGLLAHLPIKHELDPEEIGAEIFIQSLGCVGIVKTMLQRALMKALNRRKCLDLKILRSCYYSKTRLDVMHEEMIQGGKKIQELLQASDFDDWLTKTPDKPAKVEPDPPRKRTTRLKPFEKKPSRRWKQHPHMANNQQEAND